METPRHRTKVTYPTNFDAIVRSFIPDVRAFDRFRASLEWTLKRHPGLGALELTFAPHAEGMPRLRLFAWLFEDTAEVLILHDVSGGYE